ncbi:yrdC domain-containing protein, mitochondrial-like [Vespa mandarinia]|uniref:yrdC domain-containing protein, mitochondrial-like n=1 Tax=Vespa mandarinia TaxID=7446 RepID=UPI0016097053|nr:yrdC domain-containing protein, mitochondrial-like [Vespa mandarinia]
MWSQLARLKLYLKINQQRTIMNPSTMGPMKVFLNAAAEQINLLGPEEKHWFIGGDRSIAIAVELLNKGEIIAIPTDTIYGFAGSIKNDKAITRLYEIKKRDQHKPLAICIDNVNNIHQWGIIDELPPFLKETLLPGPFTIVLKRTKALNPSLNPGIDNVGIRVPDYKFIRSVAKLAGPLALTSANESNKLSSVHPNEFSELWPELAGIFYQQAENKKNVSELQRLGSTVIDLSQTGQYKILRKGIKLKYCTEVLRRYGLKPCNN